MRLVREVPLRDRHAPLGRILFAVLVAMTASGFLIGPELLRIGGESKAGVAKSTARRYAHEAYSIWRLQNPELVCPPDLRALASLVGHRDVRDPYGEPYEMTCNARGFYVFSPGEDATRGTADDIWSGTSW